jgi:hypothetical protein
MMIILDESTPQKLRLFIDRRHTVVTTQFQGWSGLKDGDLLSAAEEVGFDLFITADQELSHQQNLRGRRLAVLVLSTNNWGAAINAAAPGSFAFLNIGNGRGKPPRLAAPVESTRQVDQGLPSTLRRSRR